MDSLGTKLQQYWKWLLAVFVVGVVLWLGWTAWQIFSSVRALQADMRQVQALGQTDKPDMRAAAESIHRLRSDVVNLRRQAGPLVDIAPVLDWLPLVGSDVQAMPALLELAGDVTKAADILVEVFAPTLVSALDQGHADVSILPQLTQAAANAQPRLEEAQEALKDAQDARDELNPGRLAPQLAKAVTQIDRLWPLLDFGVSAAGALPDLTGWDTPQIYLILAQNNDELRPTGGFITAYGRLEIERGELTSLTFSDSYTVDDYQAGPYPDPPAPLAKYMKAELWVFRDSNWSPDFPTSARQAIRLYQISHDEPIKGVISVDQDALQKIVQALQPLVVPSQTAPITAANVVSFMHESWETVRDPTRPWDKQRKDFIPLLAAAIRERFMQGDYDRGTVLTAVRQSLTERHVQIYVDEHPLDEALTGLNWDGSIIRTAGDYVMPVDANLGFNKANASIRASLEYQVDLTNLSQPKATAQLTRRHTRPDPTRGCIPGYDWHFAPYSEISRRCYWDYLRLYVPAGSRLLDAGHQSIPAEWLYDGEPSDGQATEAPSEAGKSAFANFLVVPSGQEVTTYFTYALPRGIIRQSGNQVLYHLTIQKQSGIDEQATQVTVQLPAGAEVIQTTPAASVQAGQVLWSSSLRTDADFQLLFRVP